MTPEVPRWLVEILPASTAETWVRLAPLVPRSCYLAGGTGLACHLAHRVSRDLDFMFDGEVDLLQLQGALAQHGDLAVDLLAAGTLNAVFNSTKVQFLATHGQKRLAPVLRIAGIDVASVEDIAAVKVKVVGDRGELRDYYDLMVIDERALPVEEAIALFERRYGLEHNGEQVVHIVRGLGYFGDVGDDPTLPLSREEIEAFWTKRAALVVRRLQR